MESIMQRCLGKVWSLLNHNTESIYIYIYKLKKKKKTISAHNDVSSIGWGEKKRAVSTE